MINDAVHGGSSQKKIPSARRLILLIVVGTLPLFLILPIKEHVEALYGNTFFVGGALLVVSQFTLYADTSSRRPGFSRAAKPDLAVPLYQRFLDQCRARGFRVEHGRFGADMQVASVNDGPVTILFDTDKP